jgi:hypothetical protein
VILTNSALNEYFLQQIMEVVLFPDGRFPEVGVPEVRPECAVSAAARVAARFSSSRSSIKPVYRSLPRTTKGNIDGVKQENKHMAAFLEMIYYLLLKYNFLYFLRIKCAWRVSSPRVK